ncbi:MAG: hypothetical protein V3U33_03605 [candidate division NC10 bacterium]
MRRELRDGLGDGPLHLPLLQFIQGFGRRIRIGLGQCFLSRGAVSSQMGEAKIHRNPIQPGREAGAPIEGPEAPVGTEKGLLGKVFCILDVLRHSVSQPEQILLVLANQGVEGALVALPESRNQGKFRLLHCGSLRWAVSPPLLSL